MLGQIAAPIAYLSMTKAEEEKAVREHDGRIRDLARRYCGRAGSIDDLVQDGRLAFLVALRSWRQQSSLWTYARYFVLGAMLAAAKSGADDAEVFADGDGDAEAADPAPSAEEILVARELLGLLSGEDRRVVLARLVEQKTDREIAAETGMSKSEVDRTWHSSISLLRSYLSARRAGKVAA